jgi:hypothetical protein
MEHKDGQTHGERESDAYTATHTHKEREREREREMAIVTKWYRDILVLH